MQRFRSRRSTNLKSNWYTTRANSRIRSWRFRDWRLTWSLEGREWTREKPDLFPSLGSTQKTTLAVALVISSTTLSLRIILQITLKEFLRLGTQTKHQLQKPLLQTWSGVLAFRKLRKGPGMETMTLITPWALLIQCLTQLLILRRTTREPFSWTKTKTTVSKPCSSLLETRSSHKDHVSSSRHPKD